MPTFVTGHGGTAVVGSNSYACTTWRLRKSSVLADTTNALSGGYKSYKHVVMDADGTVEFIFDTSELPEQDFTPGSAITLLLKAGGGGTYTVTAVIESLEITCDNRSDVVRCSCAFKGNGAAVSYV